MGKSFSCFHKQNHIYLYFFRLAKLIHSANPKSRPVGIIVFAHVNCPSVCASYWFFTTFCLLLLFLDFSVKPTIGSTKAQILISFINKRKKLNYCHISCYTKILQYLFPSLYLGVQIPLLMWSDSENPLGIFAFSKKLFTIFSPNIFFQALRSKSSKTSIWINFSLALDRAGKSSRLKPWTTWQPRTWP